MIKEIVKKRFIDVLYQSEYITAEELAEKIGKSKGTVYRFIRKLREEGIGIMYVPGKGYIPSECASKRDDVGFLRSMLGRRASDWVALHSSEKYIKKRWKTKLDKKLLRELSEEVKPKSIENVHNMYVLLSSHNELNPSEVMKSV